jgi:mRNA interferase MazF
MNKFYRGEVWYFDPDPTRGREQKKPRPCLILSADTYNNGPSDLLIVLPLTTKKKGIPCHIEVKLEGQRQTSYIMSDQIRCISKERLTIGNHRTEKIGFVDKKTLESVEFCLKVLLGFN